MSTPATMRDLVEDLPFHMPRRPGEEVIDDPRYVAILCPQPSPYQNLVQRVRLRPDEVASTVSEVRARFAALGRRRVLWEIGSSATPADLAERLLALGMVPDPRDPLLVGMVLERPLVFTDTGIVVRPVTTFDEFRISSQILRRGTGRSEEDRAAVEASFARSTAVPGLMRFMAWLGDTPVGMGEAIYVEAGAALCGGVTLPEARGRGVYRALVAARWEEGRRRGTPVLVTQAGAMSRPILKRLGFEEVVEMRILLDEIAEEGA